MKNVNADWPAEDKFGNKIFFNFCHYTDTSYNCDSESDNFAYMLTKGGSCEQLTSNDPSAEVIEVSERISLTDLEETQDGLRIMRAGGSECPEDNLRELTFTVDIWCNPAYTQ